MMHDGVPEVDRCGRSESVRRALLQDLEEHVEDVGVGLLDLVEQHDASRAAAHRLGELAALLVAHVARGRADQAADVVLLHVLAHVEAG
jgi:DNA invertase Pin-like site-specific DNA recombinase